MTPKYFKEATKELKKPPSMTDEECSSLWIHQYEDTCLSLWAATFWERCKFLFHGHIWIGVLSGTTQPPIWLDAKQSVFTKPKKLRLLKLRKWVNHIKAVIFAKIKKKLRKLHNNINKGLT